VLLALACASVAWAGGDPIGLERSPIQFKSNVPMEAPVMDQDVLWCQNPHLYWWTANASTPFGSELADDIPRDLGCIWIYGIAVIALEWGGYWLDPAGIIVNLYDDGCPPAMAPFMSYYFPWALTNAVQVYSSPGWMEAYALTLFLDAPIQVGPTTSLGFQLDLPWGQNPPYGGCVLTNDLDVYGCGEAYWDGTYWGYPRWGTISGYFGTPVDLAYCIIGEYGPSATEQSTWGSVKTLYQ
jgi:hypothetical protein